MIFIDNKTTPISLKIPKNNSEFKENYTMELQSQATNQKYTFSGLTDASGLTDYYSFTIDFNSVKNGEYEYKIGEDKGLIQIGKISHTISAYTKDNTYIEYNA